VTARCGAETKDFAVAVCPIDQWLARARDFYGLAVDFAKVRVRASRLVFGDPGTGWTCNDVIRFRRPRHASDFPDEGTLIHELGHVWEHQSGQAQVLKGFVEQVSRAFGRDPYDFGGPAGAHRGRKLTDFKKEGQAEIIRDLWLFEHGYPSDMMGVPFSTTGYVDDLRRLVEEAGIGRTTPPPRLSSLVSSIDAGAAGIVNAVLSVIRA
jgi:hypothetical protein